MKRRAFLTLLTGVIAAPAVIRVADLMPIRVWKEPIAVGLDLGGPHGDYQVTTFLDERAELIASIWSTETNRALQAEIEALVAMDMPVFETLHRFTT